MLLLLLLLLMMMMMMMMMLVMTSRVHHKTHSCIPKLHQSLISTVLQSALTDEHTNTQTHG